jgi:hypothetical protein
MALYEEFTSTDVTGPALKAKKAGHRIEHLDDGRFRVKPVRGSETPWVHTRLCMKRNCGLWNRVYWQFYRFVPRGCYNCWKIVCKIETLKDLMKMERLQARLDLPAKCGMDRRSYTDCLYCSFWYAPYDEGLDGARKLWKRINKAVKCEVNADLKVYLKRG